MKTVIVSREQSLLIGQIVGKLTFREEFLKRRFLSLEVDDEIKASMYYYAVGICHQTYHLANPQRNLYGWDYLEYGFMEMALKKPELFNAHFLHQINPQELIQLIQPFFSPTEKPEDCTLDSLEERARLWIDMAQLIFKTGKSHLDFFLDSNSKAPYFYKSLSKSEAYSDPLQKKTSFLMKLLEDANIIQFTNNQDIIPIMDYHMQRVLLRTGCVEVVNEKLKSDLINREPLLDDIEIREACIESMKLIAITSGLSIFKMNDVFYTMGRSCCNEQMLCQYKSCEKTPCTLRLAVELESHEECIFQTICKGATQEEYRHYWQPQIQTHFY